MYGKEAMEAMSEHLIEDAFHYPQDIPVSPEEDEVWASYDQGPKEPDPIVNTVVKRLHDRSAEGMEKYGETVLECQKTTTGWIDDAIEELLDAAIYLERLKHNLIEGE